MARERDLAIDDDTMEGGRSGLMQQVAVIEIKDNGAMIPR